MISKAHTFSVTDLIDSATGERFPAKYTGAFVVRRPSIGDQRRIDLLKAAKLNAFGTVGTSVEDLWATVTYFFAFLEVCAEKGGVPDWLDEDALYEDEDIRAVLAAWREVARWRNSFRAGGSPPAGEPGSGDA